MFNDERNGATRYSLIIGKEMGTPIKVLWDFLIMLITESISGFDTKLTRSYVQNPRLLEALSMRDFRPFLKFPTFAPQNSGLVFD